MSRARIGLLAGLLSGLSFSLPAMFKTMAGPQTLIRPTVFRGRSRIPGPAGSPGSKLARKARKGQITLRHS